MDEVIAELKEIRKELAEIHSLLKRFPEIQAAVFLQMRQEAQAADLQGKPLQKEAETRSISHTLIA